MKILFMRHGESQDDLENKYGGWVDFPLTPRGKLQIEAKIPEIKKLNIDFDIIFSSPLERADSSARIISSVLGINQETFEYVKEQNTYGVLSGMEKNIAAEKYPDQVNNLNNSLYVDGAERYEDLIHRVGRSLDILTKSGHSNIIVLTHGSYLKCLFHEYVHSKLTKKEDGGFVLFDYDGNNFTPVVTSGIEYQSL